MTKRECAVVMAYTGTCMLQGPDLRYFYEYLSYLFGRPVFTHEIPELAKEISARSENDFRRICETATGDSKD